jgi:hypothetical protein
MFPSTPRPNPKSWNYSSSVARCGTRHGRRDFLHELTDAGIVIQPMKLPPRLDENTEAGDHAQGE